MSLKRAQSANPTIPKWLTRRSISTVVRPEACSSNQHAILTADHINVKWPMPRIFGSEEYGFSLVDMPDKRYEVEAAEMSAKLIHLFYDKQIIEYEWHKAYKRFVEADKRKTNLTPGVLQKSRDKAEKDVNETKEQLLRLQDQRDLFTNVIDQIWARCAQIKASIKHEQELDTIRRDLTERVKAKYPEGDPFWKTEFSVRIDTLKKKNKTTY